MRTVERNRLQVVERLDLPFLVHHRQKIVVAAVRIDPDARRNHLVGGEGRDDVRHGLLLRQAQFARAGPVNRDSQRWVIEVLRNIYVRHAAALPYLAGDLLCQRVVGIYVISRHANVNRGRRTHIQHAVHKASAGVKRLQLRQFLRNRLLHFLDVRQAAGLVVFGKATCVNPVCIAEFG